MPPSSILAEPPVAVVDGNVDAKGTRKVAEAYLEYLYSDEGQKIAAKHYYRPSKPELVDRPTLLQNLPKLELVSIDDPIFGGWAKAQPYHFGDGGVFDQIYKPHSNLIGMTSAAPHHPTVRPNGVAVSVQSRASSRAFGLTLGFHAVPI